MKEVGIFLLLFALSYGFVWILGLIDSTFGIRAGQNFIIIFLLVSVGGAIEYCKRH